MFARMWRRWCLKTKRMSFLWLALVTLLLLITCFPTTTTTTSTASTTATTPTAITTATPTFVMARIRAIRQKAATTEIVEATSDTDSSSNFWRKFYAQSGKRAAAAGALRAPAVIPAVKELSDTADAIFIPVATSQDERIRSSSSSSSSRNTRLSSLSPQTPMNYPSSNSRSRSSSSKIFSSSRPTSTNDHQQQLTEQQLYQQQQQLHADRMMYAHYYRKPAARQLAAVNASPRNPPAAVKEQQQPPQLQRHELINAADEKLIHNEDDEQEDADDEEEGEDAVEAEEADHDDEAEDEIEGDDADEEEDDVAAEPMLTLPEELLANEGASVNRNKPSNNPKRVPSFPDSPILNLYRTKAQQQQQQQKVANSFVSSAATVNVHNTKARRHAQQEEDAGQQQRYQQQRPIQHQQQLSSAVSYHSPVRETATVSNKLRALAATHGPLVARQGSAPPFRYIIESFEIPATLSFAGELTQQQRLMLFHQEQLRRLQLEEQRQQAARNRRDSRPFGLNVAMGNSNSNSHQQQLQQFYNVQQHQQFQPYQRLQQQQQQQQPQQQLQLHQSFSSNSYQNQQQQSQPFLHQHQHLHQHHSPPNHHHQHVHHLHQQQHQHQSQQRGRRRRYCSARDPAQLAFEAPTVFEGKIISMTPDRRANFSATVEVKEIFKQQIGFRLQKYLRLQFAYRNTSGECDIYREQLRPRGLVRGDELEQGRIYLLFVQQMDLGNFTILGQPIRKTRRVIEAVKNAVSENYAQLAAIRSISASNRTVENGKELRIVCKVQGRPPPKVTWFKDHKSINRNRLLYQIVPFKKRSELIIKSFNSSDAGRYECRAKNKVNRNLERRAIVIKAFLVPRYETHSTGGTGHSCPSDAAEFCFNGGTCKLFVEIGSYSCICPEGFIGERCDRKEINNMPPNPTYKTGYIADDPNAYDAREHSFEVGRSQGGTSSSSSPFNLTAFDDDTNEDVDDDEEGLEEY